MKDVKKICKIAVIQAAPVMFDKDACTQKAVDLIQEHPGGEPSLWCFRNCSYRATLTA